jgi:hypothetical protein
VNIKIVKAVGLSVPPSSLAHADRMSPLVAQSS